MNALQHDIAGLLRAVVDINARAVEIIARIEAGIPNSDTPISQPAPSPGAQNEGPGNQGGDQRAQKSDAAATVSVAGAAKAAVRGADRRNSSRPAGEVASAPLPVDRTSDPDQPARIVKARPPRPALPKPEPELNPDFDCFGVVAIDSKAYIVRGPSGREWQTTGPVARTLKRMNDGQIYGLEALRDAGDWSSFEKLEFQIRSWRRELVNIGVELVETKGIGCLIRRAA